MVVAVTSLGSVGPQVIVLVARDMGWLARV